VSRVVLYGAAGCHLCDRARATVVALRDELGFELREIDITGDEELESRYRELLPVVEIDGRRAFAYHVPAAALRRALAAQTPPSEPSLYLPAAAERRRLAHLSFAVTSPERGERVADRLTVGVAARLSRYLQVLTQAKKMGKGRISSQEISDYTNINATQIRRDLSAFGKFGKRGVGYNIDSLLGEIRKILRTQGQHNIALVGAGRLGQAIASSPIFAEHGINIAAVFDKDPEKVGRTVGGSVSVSDYRQLSELVRDKNIIVGVLAVPADNAQQVANDLVDAGVKILFNYSEALLDVPADVQVHTSNPAVELLYALYFYLT
jgi:redox-sensing transcriptional repressor